MKSNELNKFNQLVGFTVENWQGCKYPEKISLSGKYCRLVPLDIAEHAEQLFDVLSADNPGDSWTYLPSGYFANSHEFKDWLQLKLQEKETLIFVIIDNSNHRILGMCGYLRTCPEHGVIEIGHFHFSKLLKRTRLATEAVYLMMSYLFDDLLYRRCEWKCHNLNEASKRAAMRFGFQFEGVFRQSNVFENRNRDTAWFSLLDCEWPSQKIKFQKWLDPNNFDDNGKQKIRLKGI